MDEKIVKDSQGLAKELVNDCISRQAAIERATKDHDFYKGATTPADMARRDELLNVMCWLGELPSAPLKSYRKGYQAGFNEGYQAGFKDAQLEQPWIPCSERLPKNGYWLWSSKGGEVQKDFYWDGHWEQAEKYGYEVIAWMPLPEPYKEEK